MKEVVIKIATVGLPGSGKTRAIQKMIAAIEQSEEFEVLSLGDLEENNVGERRSLVVRLK